MERKIKVGSYHVQGKDCYQRLESLSLVCSSIQSLIINKQAMKDEMV